MNRDYIRPLVAFIVGLVMISGYFSYRTVLFTRAEHNLYGWDFLGMWLVNADLIEHFRHGILDGIATFGRSFHHIYNDMWAFPSALAMGIWGNSRFCYAVSNTILLVIPSSLLCMWLFAGPGRFTWSGVGSSLLAYLALVAVPLPWEVGQFGETDPGILFMAAVTTSLLIRTDIRTSSRTHWLIIGGALATIALSKRYELYLVVGLLAVLFSEVALDFLSGYYRTRTLTWRSLIKTATGPFLCLCSLVGVFLLSFPLPLEMMRHNYAYEYAAHQAGGTYPDAVRFNVARLVTSYGAAQVALAVLSFVAGLFLPTVRRGAVYLFVPAGLAVADFSRVQSMEPHHQLLVYLALVVTPVFLASRLLAAGLPAEKYGGFALLAAAALISCVSYSSVFAPVPPFGASMVQEAFPRDRIQPVQRHDFEAISALLRFLDRKVAPAPGEKPSVYVLASSVIVNSSLLSSAAFQMNEATSPTGYICQTYDVDTAGFPNDLLTAKWVLVADPMQTNVAAEQKVVTVPTREFLQNQGFAQAFVRDPEVFQLDQGVRIYAFERTRPSTPEEIARLQADVGITSPPSANGSR